MVFKFRETVPTAVFSYPVVFEYKEMNPTGVDRAGSAENNEIDLRAVIPATGIVVSD
ncbi:MAG: hypothetical protein IPL53_13530 [Ignavibacteria bacterium]|nr:hypothetical protein [Ignavibacteria bacterium]